MSTGNIVERANELNEILINYMRYINRGTDEEIIIRWQKDNPRFEIWGRWFSGASMEVLENQYALSRYGIKHLYRTTDELIEAFLDIVSEHTGVEAVTLAVHNAVRWPDLIESIETQVKLLNAMCDLELRVDATYENTGTHKGYAVNVSQYNKDIFFRVKPVEHGYALNNDVYNNLTELEDGITKFMADKLEVATNT